ncbi:hypothetical protein H7I94_05020 [Mycobacterium szulgai]|nr:hypothetical protein [Mycobacterium szulgai]MCV7075151.1 hypothetical protein [Mycobacterium szulgai]
MQRLLADIGDRAVGGLDNSQGRALGLDEKHCYALVSDRLPDRLGQGCRGEERRDKHDVIDLARGQRIAQRGGLEQVGRNHADRGELVAGVVCALAGAQDGGERLVDC